MDQARLEREFFFSHIYVNIYTFLDESFCILTDFRSWSRPSASVNCWRTARPVTRNRLVSIQSSMYIISSYSKKNHHQVQYPIVRSSATTTPQLSLQFALLPWRRVSRHPERSPVSALSVRLLRRRAQLPQVSRLQRRPLLRGSRLHGHRHWIHVSVD